MYEIVKGLERCRLREVGSGPKRKVSNCSQPLKL